MKQRNIFIMVLLVFHIALTMSIVMAGQAEDDRGKLVGQILDAATGLPVKELFDVTCFYYTENGIQNKPIYFNSGQNGMFFQELKEGRYCIAIFPTEKTSKYCNEPGSLMSELFFNYDGNNPKCLEIKRGQITKITKHAYVGGKIFIYIVDEKGVKINPMDKFSKKEENQYSRMIYTDIRGSITSNGIVENASIYNLRNGISEIDRLFPGLYKIKISFGLIGYGSIYFELEVKSEKTTEKEVIIDMTNNTGIEGMVSDQDGHPVEGAIIRGGNGANRTDKNGLYRIVNAKTGKQKLYIEFEVRDGVFYNKKINIDIQEDVILRTDIVLKIIR